MTENFLIAIMQRLGGDSRHVGTALFIASMAVTPTIFCFAAIRKRIPDGWLLKIAALSFLAQAVLYDLAQSVTAVWRCQLIQLTSYAFLEPALVYYANAKVRSCDMVKGQAFATAAYALAARPETSPAVSCCASAWTLCSPPESPWRRPARRCCS